MARTVVGYVKKWLNNMASTSPSASVEAATGLAIATGLNVGAFQEFSDSEALGLSYTPWGTLYGGTYEWAQLDPAVVTSPIPMGTPVFWLETAAGKIVTTADTGNNPDFAGITIDSNFGAAFPYAFIQRDGKVSALFDASPATAFGDVIGLTSVSANTVTRQGAATQALTGLSLGISLVATGTASVRNLIRIVFRSLGRY